MSSSPSRPALPAARAKPAPPRPLLQRLLPSFFKPSDMDVVLFSRQLAVFLRAGVPLVPAVEALAEQTGSGVLRDLLVTAREDLIAGDALSAALARRSDAFPRIYVDMVRAGEATGRLEVVLGQVADQIERSASARRRLQAALLYPALVILVAVAMVVVMTAFVLPAMAGLFTEFGTDLPLPTRVVLNVAVFTREWGLTTVAAIAALALAVVLFSKTAPGARLADRVALRLPVVGGIRRDAIVERTTRTLGTLLAAGVPLANALALVAETTGSAAYRRHLVRVRRRMLAGEGFAVPFCEGPLFPPLVKQMARVGERAGTLDQFLRESAKYYAEQLELEIETALQLLEPALTISVALVVGFVALAVIMPIYSLIGNIK